MCWLAIAVGHDVRSEESADLDRASYLVALGNCVSCHTRPGGAEFAGGLPFTTPFGTLYSSNITPDPDAGIGRWSRDDFRRAMHEGIAPGGRHLFPAFPYPAFTRLSDQDVDLIYDFLRRLPSVSSRPPNNAFAFRLRWAMAGWNRLFFKPGRFVVDATQSAEWNRGAYLVEGLGHCSACHTPRNAAMAEMSSRAFQGGAILEKRESGATYRWSAVNLTSAKEGLAAWSPGDLAKYLKTGFAARAGSFGPMNDVITNSLVHLSAEDAQAMATYLKSLPARDSKGSTVSAEQAKAGEQIYKDRCEKCHMSSGRGGFFGGPPLAGSAVAQSDDPASLINVILDGPKQPASIAFGSWETMKPYRDLLKDDEIAAVANFVRGSWGNRGGPVSARDVAEQR